MKDLDLIVRGMMALMVAVQSRQTVSLVRTLLTQIITAMIMMRSIARSLEAQRKLEKFIT